MAVHKKFYNWPRPLFKPRADHACHQKPNLSRETVPLKPKSKEDLLSIWIGGMAAGLGKEVGSAAAQNPCPHNADPGIRAQHLCV